MEFRILGPLQVLEQGGELPLGPAKERAVLGVLLLHAGSVVSRIQLVDCLWGERAPLTAEKALNNYVSQLRQTLSQAGAKLIETKAPGYVLTPGADALDVTRFHRLATAARERERAGELEAAAAVMKDALEVWRGSALAGVELEGEGRHDVARLEELRLLAQSDLVDYKLGLGRHEELVAELERLVAQHPLDERVQGQFILALYRSGRQADALQAYRATRETLIDTLGIEPSAPLQRLERAILNHDPSLEAPAGVASQPRAWRKGTLPVPTNSLLGRRRELKQLADLLTGPGRLVTITGSGGSGKTRLALAAAEKVADTFSEGASFVSLAPLRHERHVAAAIAAPLGVRDFDELGEREALLVLDNFEHLVAAAPVVSALLAAAPRLKAFVTSRSPLRIAGEIEYPLAPLDEDDALALFVERASAVRPGLDADDASREICRRLDCLPLALELAAPHLRSLRPAALLERLQPRLPLLSGGRRDAPERQRTLRATIAWSYTLLDADLQTRFAHLSVFAGGFSLSAAEAVAGASFDQVERLVEASLVTPADSDRFLMLETIREFASEQVNTVVLEATRADHADFFAALAEDTGLTIDSAAPMEHSRAIADLDNYRAAVDWAVGANRTTVALRLATALGFLWVTSDPIGAMPWFERLLADSHDEAGVLRPRALYLYAVLTSIAGEWEQVERLGEQSLAEARGLGDDGAAANALLMLATSAHREGDATRARALLEQSLALHRKTGFRKGEAQVHGMLGSILLAEGAHARGFEEIERSITLAHDAGFPWWEKNELCFLAEQLLAFGRIDDAGGNAVRALRIATAIGDRVGQVDAFAILAHVAAERNDLSVAGRLWGAAESEAARAPFPGWERTRRLHLAAVRPEAAFEIARGEGAELTLDQAAEEFLHTRS